MIELVELKIVDERRRAAVIERLDLHVEPGEIYGLIGPAGSGKTAVLEAIADLRPIARGRICVGSARPGIEVERHRRQRLTAVWGTGALDSRLTVRQNIRLILHLSGVPVPAPSVIDRALRRVDLPDRSFDRRPDQLSPIQRCAVWFAVARLRRTAVLLIDDPAQLIAGPDMQLFYDLLEDLRAEGQTILMVTRDAEFGCRVATRVGVLERGQKVAEGTPTTVFQRSTDAPGGEGHLITSSAT